MKFNFKLISIIIAFCCANTVVLSQIKVTIHKDYILNRIASNFGMNTLTILDSVIEDALSGIAAGCKCLALTTSFPADKLKQADWICKDLSEVLDEFICI